MLQSILKAEAQITYFQIKFSTKKWEERSGMPLDPIHRGLSFPLHLDWDFKVTVNPDKPNTKYRQEGDTGGSKGQGPGCEGACQKFQFC